MINYQKEQALLNIQAALDRLDETDIIIDGKRYRMSECYSVGIDHTNIFFYNHCPDALRSAIEGILNKYLQKEEN